MVENKEEKMKLFEPIKVCGMTIKNRIIMPGMGTNLGIRNETARGYYEARARGGVGAIVIAGIMPDAMIDKNFAKEFYRWIGEPIQKYDVKVGPQLWFGNQYPGFWKEGVLPDYIAPSPGFPPGAKAMQYFYQDTHCYCREISKEEINDIIDRFVSAAIAAKEVGFDFVELHACHGHNLPHQFFSPIDNRRTDEYGGDLEGRMRFCLELARAIKKAIGEDYPFLWRLSAEEGLRYGYTIEESITLAAELENAGVDIIDVSFGHEAIDEAAPSAPFSPCPGEESPVATFIPLAEAIKRHVSLPVVGVGRMHDPELAEQALNENKVDIIAIGRQLLADPYWPNKVKMGQDDEIVPCLYCNQCLYNIELGRPIECSVNAALGRENLLHFKPTPRSKKILVIGGGPAGMEAARRAASRGHKVVLYEKGYKLGGQLLIAGTAPYKSRIETYRKFMENELSRLGVSIRYGFEVNRETVIKESPEAIVLATGSLPSKQNITGEDKPNVVLAEDILLNKVAPGKTVVIIGGGRVGCETAEYLADKNHKVIIIEIKNEILPSFNDRLRNYLQYRLTSKGVSINTGIHCECITEYGVDVVGRSGRKIRIKADHIVFATGAKANNSLEHILHNLVKELYIAGDCIKPRDISSAVLEGAIAGTKI